MKTQPTPQPSSEIPPTPAAHQPPSGPRRPSNAMRWLGITARTGHIAATGVLFGGFILLVPFARLGPWHLLTIATGCTLLLLEWLHDARWPHRGKGLLALLHLALCLLIHLTPGLAVPLLWLIVISGCIGSHMPRRYRHWSFLQGWEIADKDFPRP